MAKETQEITNKKPTNPVGTEDDNREYIGVLDLLPPGGCYRKAKYIDKKTSIL